MSSESSRLTTFTAAHAPHTERLRLRRLTPADADALTRLDAEPGVLRFLDTATHTPAERLRDEVLPRMLAYDTRPPGYGYWAAEEKTTGEPFVGWFELRPDGNGVAELGYRLHPRYWGHGYATEGARALIDLGFAEFGLRHIRATTMAVNLASRRVLEKSGLAHVATVHPRFDDPIDGTEQGEVEYAIEQTEWAVRRIPRR